MSEPADLDERHDEELPKPRWYAQVPTLDYLRPEDVPTYQALVADGAPVVLDVCLLKRHGKLATTLPWFAWTDDPAKATALDELTWRQGLFGDRKRGAGFRANDVVHKEGRWYYRAVFLSAVKHRLRQPLVAEALTRFLLKVEGLKADKDRFIRSNPYPSERQYIPPEDRVRNSRRHRGPTWTTEDDYVVRKWFGRHNYGPHAGRHAPLTEDQWKHVLLELGGRRAKSEVLRRIRVLNHELKVSLMVDGMITGAGVQKYLREALGESEPKPPKHRPRIKGRNYWGN